MKKYFLLLLLAIVGPPYSAQPSSNTESPSRYELIQGNFNWFEAKVDAERRGGHLATITTQQEWNAIRNQIGPSQLEGRLTWLGATDSRIEGQWEWITGEPWGGFLNWREGEPNSTAGGVESDYIELLQLPNNPWNDTSGQDRLNYYLLERPSPVKPTIPILDLEFVTIGDPGNPADSTGYGKVDYEYLIGKYEVNNTQYAAFLNAKAKTDRHSLYDVRESSHNGILRSGSSGSYAYSVKPGMERKPGGIR